MPTYPPAPTQQKRGLGCVGIGCIVLAVVAVLLVMLVGGISYYGYTVLEGYTDTAPTTVPEFDGGDQVLQAAHRKLAAFQQAVEHSQPASLKLSADEINTLIARDPSYAKAHGHLFVTMKDDEATLQGSFLLGSVENMIFTDRYLNGVMTFGLSFNSIDKSIILDLHATTIKGRELPPSFDESFNSTFNTTLNQRIQADPATRAFLQRTQKISIENSQLVIETQ